MSQRGYWFFILIAAAILMITMGARQSLGLFMYPLNIHTGLGIATISFAMAVGQLVWGAVQPVFGAVADRWGPGRVIVFGAFLLAAGCVLTTQVTSEFGLILAIGIMSAAGAGAGSFSVLIGATSQHIPAQRRSFAGGVINAGGSAGQFIFAPLNQAVMSAFGWMHAMWMMAVLALTTAPMAWWLRGRPKPKAAIADAQISLRQQLKIAAYDRSYWCLQAGFFT
ncbi:MAG TPA: MFS transporter, partial [Cellvibrio sp.]